MRTPAERAAPSPRAQDLFRKQEQRLTPQSEKPLTTQSRVHLGNRSKDLLARNLCNRTSLPVSQANWFLRINGYVRQAIGAGAILA